MPQTSRVAFIGLGIMGHAMAGNLLSGGVDLTVYNRTSAKADDLLARGARWANTPACAAADADVLFLCVTDTADVDAVIFGTGGIAESIRPGSIIVDHSTISAAATRQFSARLKSQCVDLLDAPVSGGDLGARNATLSIMVGGEESAFTRVFPLLQFVGKTITHCGPSGAGQLTKQVNQVLVSVTNLAVCEALTLAEAGGLDLPKTIAAVAGGAAGSWQLSNLGPKMAARDYRPGFKIDLQQKDLRLVRETAASLDLNLNAADLVARLFAIAQNQGHGSAGTQALFEVVSRQCEKSSDK